MFSFYPEVEDEFFNYKICKKLEYIKLGVSEDIYAFQQVMSQFLNPKTPYNSLLNCSHAGVGKTYSALLLMSEYIGKDVDETTKPMFLCENNNTQVNFKEQMKKFLPNLFQNKSYKNTSSTRRENTKSVKHYIDLCNYDTLARELKEMSESEIQEKYGRRVLVICDEIHYIRVKDKMKGEYKSTYTQLKRFFEVYTGKKVFLTATPSASSIKHFPSIINLLIPKEWEPVNSNKLSELEGKELLHYLAPYLTGRVLFMKQHAMPRRVMDQGEPIKYLINLDGKYKRPKMEKDSHKTFIPVIQVPMSKFQHHLYVNQLNKYKLDVTHRSLDIELRSISNTAFLEGSGIEYDKKLKRYIIGREMLQMLEKEGIEYFSPKYNLICQEIIQDYKKGCPGFTFSFFHEYGVIAISLYLEYLSKKYYEKWLFIKGENKGLTDTEIMNKLYPNREDFIKAEVMLQPFTFHDGRKSVDQILVEGPKPRFSMISQSQSNSLMTNIRELFNHPLNRDGSYLLNIIGSEKISTSTNLPNGQVFRCTCAVWTASEYIQSADRIMRSDSQSWLPLNQRTVYNYSYASVFNVNLLKEEIIGNKKRGDDNELELRYDLNDIEEMFSIEEKMYIRCSEKYRKVQELMNVIECVNLCGKIFRERNGCMDSYFDGDLPKYRYFYGNDAILVRNQVGELIWKVRDFEWQVDISTYKQDNSLYNHVLKFLCEKSVTSVTEITKHLGKSKKNHLYLYEQVMLTLKNMFMESCISELKDQFGVQKYLRYSENSIYLSSERGIFCDDGNNNFLDVYYANKLYIPEKTDDTVVYANQLIAEMETCMDHDFVYKKVVNSTVHVQAYLLETSILKLNFHHKKDASSQIFTKEKCELLMRIFHHKYYVFIYGEIVSVIHTIFQLYKTRNQKSLKSKNLLRILTEKDEKKIMWRNCSKMEDMNYIKKINHFIQSQMQVCLKNSKKLYDRAVVGIINTTENMFRVLDHDSQIMKLKPQSLEEDRRTIHSGGQMTKYSPFEILEILYYFKVFPFSDSLSLLMNSEDVLSYLKRKKIKNIPTDPHRQIYYYLYLTSSLNKNDLYKILENKLKKLNLVVYM
jgi:hypothetical protein